VTPKQLLRNTRGHWQVENDLHYPKDRWWDEDRWWCRRPGLAERRTLLLNIALSLLRLAVTIKSGLRATADELAWNPRKAINLLGSLE
jgi:predicted transposase YbfD/YdcC